MVFGSYMGFSQVGVGNTNPQATLDISASNAASPASNDGILIPRMSSFPSSPGATRDGMLIFYTGTGASGKGFYYWDQPTLLWIKIAAGSTVDVDWYEEGTSAAPDNIYDNMFTQGNVGIGENVPQARLHVNDAATPLRLDIDGTERFSFRNNSLEFLNNGSSVFIGEDAGNNDDLSGNQNTAIGYRALRNNVTGARNIAIGSGALLLSTGGNTNIAIGDDAMAVSSSGSNNVATGTQTLFRNTTGSNNVAVGGTALRENTVGINNVALGYRALYNTTGNNNIGIGYETGFANIAGIGGNTFIGTGAGHTTTGGRNVFLGYNAGYNETGSYKLYIENTNSSNPLIYGEFDTNILRINGEFQVSDPSTTGYALPNADGAANQVLTTDGAGQLSFVNASSLVTVSQNTLDEAYDEGGAGAGRTITADNGAVEIEGAGGLRVVGPNVDIGASLRHDGDLDTFMMFSPNRIEFESSGRNYIDIQNSDLEVTFNEGGLANDFRVETNANSHMLFVDGSESTFGINVTNPDVELDVLGNTEIYGGLTHQGNLLTVSRSAQTNGAAIFAENTSSYNLRSYSAIQTANALTDMNVEINKFITGGEDYGILIDGSNADIVGDTGVKIDFNNTSSLNYVGETIGFDSEITYNGGTSGTVYGYKCQILGSGLAPKYGAYISIPSSSNGNQYGVYSDVRNTSGYAGYFLGRISLGTGTTNRYVMPLSDGTANQIMATDGSGTVSFVDTSSIFTDTDDQTLSLVGTTLSIADGNSVNLSALQDGTGNDWSLSGNIGLGSSFLGTTNNSDLRIRTNNIEKLRVSTQGQIEFYNSGQSIFIGQQAGENDDLTNNYNTFVGYRAGTNNISGFYNTALGHNSLSANTTGGRNLALGSGALLTNTTGYDNIALGSAAMVANTTESYNIAIGYATLFSMANGNSNIAIGYRAGAKDITSNQNVYLGYEAGSGLGSGPDENKSGNVFIGYRSGYNESGNNKLYIENSNASNPLIYGEFDNNILRFNGNVGIGRAPATNALEVEGQASKTTAGAFVANSDKRLKKNIEHISGDFALEKINRLQGVTYEWNDKKTGTFRPTGIQYGFIAQDIQKVFPEKVTEDNLGFLQTAYGDYDPLVIEAIKELHSKIETLETENKNLKLQLNKFQNIESRLAALEQNGRNSSSNKRVNATEE